MADTKASIQELDSKLRSLKRMEDDYINSQHQLILNDIPRMQAYYEGDARIAALLDEMSADVRIEMEHTLAAIGEQEDSKERPRSAGWW